MLAWCMLFGKLVIKYISKMKFIKTSLFVRSEVLIHGGSTQEFYSNRLDLDDHAEDMLTFGFGGLRTLLQLALKQVRRYGLNPDGLPLSLQEMVRPRAPLEAERPLRDPPALFPRSLRHLGI